MKECIFVALIEQRETIAHGYRIIGRMQICKHHSCFFFFFGVQNLFCVLIFLTVCHDNTINCGAMLHGGISIYMIQARHLFCRKKKITKRN